MSEIIELQAQAREQTGTSFSRGLRRNNRVPAIIYGGDVEPEPISLSLFDLQRRLQEESFYTSILEIDTPKGRQRAVLKALDKHPLRDEPMHLDFLRVTDSTRVTMPVPLALINEDVCIGVKEGGGVVTSQLTSATVVARADSIPEHLEVDMAEVPIGQPVHLSSVPLPKGVSIPLLDQGQDPTVVIVLPPKISRQDIEADQAEAEAAEAEAAEAADEGASEDSSAADEAS